MDLAGNLEGVDRQGVHNKDFNFLSDDICVHQGTKGEGSNILLTIETCPKTTQSDALSLGPEAKAFLKSTS